MVAIAFVNIWIKSLRIRLPVRRGGGERRQGVARGFDACERRKGIEGDAGAPRIGELWNEADVGERRRCAVAELACRSLARELRFERGESQVDPVAIPAILRFLARADRAGQVPQDTEIVERMDIARDGHGDGANASPHLRSW